MVSSHKRKRHHLVSEESESVSEDRAHSALHIDDDETGPDDTWKKDPKKARPEETSVPEKPHIPQKDSEDIPAALPAISNYLTIAHGGSHWHARQSFQNIVVFGDSYSKTNEGDTWLDHLRRRIRCNPSELLNLAFPGATAEDDLSEQLSRFFRTLSGKNNDQTRALDPDRTIYFVFLGINDCGATEQDELDSIVENIFDALHNLYVKAGARNFVLFDVPPIDRSPQAITSEFVEVMEDRVKTWNELLQSKTAEFGLSSGKATIFLFSAHQVLTDVLEDPVEYDFSEDDPTDESGCIWADDLHLTSEVHDVVAERLLTALLGSSS